MKTTEFIGKFKSAYLWGNIIAMAIVVVVACCGVKYGLDIYTHHGESIPIPDVRHKNMSDAVRILEDAGFTVEVADTGYVKNLPPDCVLEQSPVAGKQVKSGHVIMLTVNASHTPTLALPDIIDNSSLREAMAKLTAMGFKLTQPQFVPGEKDWVYGVVVGGRSVVAGDRISIEDAVTIQVGNGQLSATDSVDMVEGTPVLMDDDDDVDDFHEVTAPSSSEHDAE